MQRDVPLHLRYRCQQVPPRVIAEQAMAKIGGDWKDTLSFSSAQGLADKIREAWLGFGYIVQVIVEPVGSQHSRHFAVRSDLLNGLPQRKVPGIA